MDSKRNYLTIQTLVCSPYRNNVAGGAQATMNSCFRISHTSYGKYSSRVALTFCHLRADGARSTDQEGPLCTLYLLARRKNSGANHVPEQPIKIGHEKDGSFIQSVRAPILRPDRRANDKMFLSPHKRIATRELRQWPQNCSIILFVESLAAKSGTIFRKNADYYLVREIKNTGLALATFLD